MLLVLVRIYRRYSSDYIFIESWNLGHRISFHYHRFSLVNKLIDCFQSSLFLSCVWSGTWGNIYFFQKQNLWVSPQQGDSQIIFVSLLWVSLSLFQCCFSGVPILRAVSFVLQKGCLGDLDLSYFIWAQRTVELSTGSN